SRTCSFPRRQITTRSSSRSLKQIAPLQRQQKPRRRAASTTRRRRSNDLARCREHRSEARFLPCRFIIRILVLTSVVMYNTFRGVTAPRVSLGVIVILRIAYGIRQLIASVLCSFRFISIDEIPSTTDTVV